VIVEAEVRKVTSRNGKKRKKERKKDTEDGGHGAHRGIPGRANSGMNSI